MVEEFNRGVYDIIIASDEKSEMLNVDEDDEDGDVKKAAEDAADKDGDDKRPKKKRKMARKDSEYGVSRGMYTGWISVTNER